MPHRSVKVRARARRASIVALGPSPRRSIWIAIIGLVGLTACGSPVPDPPRLTPGERETLQGLTAWDRDTTFELVKVRVPDLQPAEQPFPVPLRVARGSVSLFEIAFEGEFHWGADGLVRAGYSVDELEESEARALFDRLRSGLEELYGDFEGETSQDPPLIGQRATWSADGRSVTVIMIRTPDEERWSLFCLVIYGSGTIPWERPGS